MNTIPSWLAFVGLLCLPESPKYLLSVGKPRESLRILKRVYILNNGNSPEFPCRRLAPLIENTSYKKESKLSKLREQFKELFGKERILQTLNFSFVLFSLSFIGLGIYMWLPITISYYLEDSSLDEDICSVIGRAQDEPLDGCDSPVDTFEFLLMMFNGIAFTVFYLFLSQMAVLIRKKILISKFLFFN